MVIEVKKPGRRTKGGKPSSAQPAAKPQDIYDVRDSNGDKLTVALDDISPNPFNRRKMRNLDEMSASIINDGLDTPVVVMHTSEFVAFWGDRFPEECARLTTTMVLGPGERRWRGAKLAAEETGITTIPAILRNDQVPTIRETLFRENYHREDPSPLERARDIQELVDEGMSYPEVCQVLNIKSKGTITKLLGLLKLSSAIQSAVEEQRITQRAALELGGLDADEAEMALQLMLNEDMKVDVAIHKVRTTPIVVSPGNTPAEGAQPATPSAVEPVEVLTDAGPIESEPEPEVLASDEPPQSGEPPAPISTESPLAEAKAAPTATKIAKPTSGSTSTKDQTAADRSVAARERESSCVEWLRSDVLPSANQVEELIQRALLAAGKHDGRSKAHAWLVRAGRAHFDIKDVDGYFGAVLSSGDDDLIRRATWAVALAGSETRAADRRRPGWDTHDAAHVQELMTAVGYVPATSWEIAELKRLGVSPGNSPDHTEQESE